MPTDVDLLQQALTNSGLSNGNVVSSATLSAPLSESVSAAGGMSKDAEVSVLDVPSSVASGRPTAIGFLSTMAVHDSVTGTVRRHPVRKVCDLYAHWIFNYGINLQAVSVSQYVISKYQK